MARQRCQHSIRSSWLLRKADLTGLTGRRRAQPGQPASHLLNRRYPSVADHAIGRLGRAAAVVQAYLVGRLLQLGDHGLFDGVRRRAVGLE